MHLKVGDRVRFLGTNSQGGWAAMQHENGPPEIMLDLVFKMRCVPYGALGTITRPLKSVPGWERSFAVKWDDYADRENWCCLLSETYPTPLEVLSQATLED